MESWIPGLEVEWDARAPGVVRRVLYSIFCFLLRFDSTCSTSTHLYLSTATVLHCTNPSCQMSHVAMLFVGEIGEHRLTRNGSIRARLSAKKGS